MNKINIMRHEFQNGEVVLVQDDSYETTFICDDLDEAREFANSYDGDCYYFIYGDEAELTEMFITSMQLPIYRLKTYDYETKNGETGNDQPHERDGVIIAVDRDLAALEKRAQKLDPRVVKMSGSGGTYYLHENAWEILTWDGYIEKRYYPIYLS